MNKKVLVTGGSGFLGINLIRYLRHQGVTDITVLDLVEFDYPERDEINAVIGDIRNIDDVRKVMKDVDWVIHTAAALPLYTEEEIFSTDIEGTRLLLQEAQHQMVERFIHISSTAVYGIPDHHPLVEDDQLIGVGAYGIAKIEAEKIAVEYRDKGMCISIIRPKSFVGPERLGVFALFYDWAKDGKNFPMIGNGHNRYQLLDVEDLCEAIYLCLIKDAGIVSDIFNIGATDFTTMREDYQAVLDRAGHGKKIVGTPAKPLIGFLRILEFFKLSPLYKWVYETACEDSFVSTEKIEAKLNFYPKFSNKQALIRNYEWYLDNLHTFEGKKSGISHRVPWGQGILKFFKLFF